MAKIKDLQPWFDYFDMLRTYEEKGFLGIDIERHEAYVTQPALYTLAGCSSSTRVLGHDMNTLHVLRSIMNTVRHLRTYAAWKAASVPKEATTSETSASGAGQSFAVNVVKDDGRHDPLFTIVITTRRKWYCLWLLHDHFDVITY